MDNTSAQNDNVEKLVWQTPEITVIPTDETAGGSKGLPGPESLITSS